MTLRLTIGFLQNAAELVGFVGFDGKRKVCRKENKIERKDCSFFYKRRAYVDKCVAKVKAGREKGRGKGEGNNK